MAVNVRQRLHGAWKTLIQGRDSIPFRGPGHTWEIPPGWNYTNYLQAYGNVGWLFGCVSRIGQAVADVPWHLYKTAPGKAREEIEQHVLLDLMAYVNPFQTWAEFCEMGQMYLDLVGETFIILLRNGLGVPAEMWLVPPNRMYIIPDRQTFIKGYLYKFMGDPIPLETTDVIHIKLPNPLDPYRGLGPVQAISVDLAGEQYAAQWNTRFFFNSAEPGMVIEAPEGLSDDEFKRLKEQWEAEHKGFSRAHRVTILERASVNRITIGQREMDFWRLRKVNRDVILGAYGVHPHLMGISEQVNKANAEAAEYSFAKRVVEPRLSRWRGKLNEQLCPMFSEGIELDYENPVADDRDLKLREIESGIKNGFLTVNEAREAMGYDAIPTGNVFLIPLNSMPSPAGGKGLLEARALKALPSGNGHKAWDEEQKELFWCKYIDWTSKHEHEFITAMRDYFGAQEREALRNLERAMGPDAELFRRREWEDRLNETILPILTDVMREAIERSRDLIESEPVHRAGPEPVLVEPVSGDALIWLMDEAATLVTEVTATTVNALRVALTDGFAAGDSIPHIADRIRGVFDDCSQRRAVLIARTEVIAASAEGALQGYDTANVENVEFYAALDERTCPECQGLHTQTFLRSDGKGKIPVHPNCRCVWLPMLE